MRKFFPESRAYLDEGHGPHWEDFLEGMFLAEIHQDFSSSDCLLGTGPMGELESNGGLNGSDVEVYEKLLNQTGYARRGRAVIVPDTGWECEEGRPIICDARRVSERLGQWVPDSDTNEPFFNHFRDSIFAYESGEAMVIDHHCVFFWLRSKINRAWER